MRNHRKKTAINLAACFESNGSDEVVVENHGAWAALHFTPGQIEYIQEHKRLPMTPGAISFLIEQLTYSGN